MRPWTLPGFFPGALAGLIIALLTQLHYLSAIAWELPAWRLAGAILLGPAFGILLTLGLGRILASLKIIKKDRGYAALGYALLLVSLLGWLIWDPLAEQGLLWILFILWGILVPLMGKLIPWLEGMESSRRKKGIQQGLLAVILIFGLSLRLSGLFHGLPQYIVHCDTPKQLALIPNFVQGDFAPPTSYPVGHIYLYSGIIKLFQWLLGASGPLPALTPQTFLEFVPLIKIVRVLQALLSTAIPLFVFLFARLLVNPWAGLTAAFLVACDPVHLTYTRQEMGEIPQTFWVMASLFFAARLRAYGKSRDIFLAGLFAGVALATKIYGGYIVLAGLGAFWFSSKTRWRQSPWLLIGFLAGIVAASPFLWIAPADWWNDLLAESFFQYRIGTPALTATKFTTITTGLNYLPRVLIYRFEWPWFVLALGGLFFLFFFRPRKNLFFIIPYSASLAIIALRLSYLREWDLVNLTPFLSLSIAFLITGLLETITNKVLRGSAFCLFGLFLIFQGAVAWGEAWIARFPDTREFARRWVLQQVDRGSTLNYDLNLSSTYSVWVPENAGIKLSGARINRFLSEKDKTSPPPGQAWVLERTWWEPTLPETRYRPIQIFKLHNTYWENPDILIFRPPFPPRPSELILPHLRVRSSEPAFPNTPWSQKQPLDLLSEPGTSSRQIFFASRDMEAMGFALLGQGKAKVYFGPALGFPVKVQQGGLTTGVLKPLRRWPPLSPRVYALHLKNPEKDQTLWLGLFPSPEEMAPLLCRFEAWKDLEQAAYMGLKRQDAPGELSLFYALALAAQKREPEARAHLENLSREKSEFLNSYRSLVSSQGQDLEEALRRMTGASRKELLREEVVWPYSNQGDDKEMAGNWPAPQVVAKSHEFHLWLPHYFLPGFFKASLNIGFQKGPASRGVHLKIIALWSGRYFKELSRIPLQPGQTEITIPIPLSIGPVRFEFQIDSQEAAWPVIQSLVLTPDHEAEWKWRWSLFNRYLDLNPFLSSTAPHPRDLEPS